MENLTSPKKIKELMKSFGTNFSKALGQNFLTDQNVIYNIVEAVDAENEGVLEIGPGIGVLTVELAKYAKKVVAVELDKRLIEILDTTLADYNNINIINSDILKVNIEELVSTEFADMPFSVAANLPYYITTPILTMLIESGINFKNIVVMVQKEVAKRICAKEGSKDYSSLSVLCQFYAKTEIVEIVPAASFVPAPKVDSAVVKLEMLNSPSVSVKDKNLFFKVVAASFAQRRKTLLNGLSNSPNIPFGKETIEQFLVDLDIDLKIRGEKLSLSDFARIADKVFDNINSTLQG